MNWLSKESLYVLYALSTSHVPGVSDFVQVGPDTISRISVHKEGESVLFDVAFLTVEYPFVFIVPPG